MKVRKFGKGRLFVASHRCHKPSANITLFFRRAGKGDIWVCDTCDTAWEWIGSCWYGPVDKPQIKLSGEVLEALHLTDNE